MQVNNIDELVKANLANNSELISCETTNLLSTGENYGSILLNVKIKVRNEKGKEDIKNWVAKIAPPTKFLWDFFNTSKTFTKEVGVYQVITPVLNKFGKEKGIDNLIDIFPAFHGSRLSLNENATEVDSDAVLLLENLKIKGYKSEDRFVGFNLELTKLFLKDLAIMHAAPIALKLANPAEFEAKIRPFLNRDFFFDTEEEQLKGFVDTLKSEASAANPACIQYFPKLQDRMMNLTKSFRSPLVSKEPFATFIHGDMWVNNILHKYEDGVAIKNKIVDFQLIEYNSPANDVLFFLYSSVQLSILENHVDDFLETYFKYFIEALKMLDCDVSLFTYKAFLQECTEMAYNLQFAHLCFMHIPMFTQKGKAKELTEWTTKDLAADSKTLHPVFGKRLEFILLDFVKRGWI